MPQVCTRPANIPDDTDFLLSLYASTRRPELAGLGWSEAEQDSFIQMQFDAQTRYYRESFPDARHCVICVNGRPAGRLIVNRCDTEMVIVDFALMPGFRRRGLGSSLVRALLEDADADGLRVSLHVLQGSDACRFWERAGFVTTGGNAAYLAMERACATLPA
jgi:GNAT superfamily N-acetyltransferase